MNTLPEAPRTNLQADLFIPLPDSHYILVVQCLYSRYPAVASVCSPSATAVIPDTNKILSDFGIPFKLGRDNGASFNSLQFRDYEKHMGFQHMWVTPYASWTN